MKTKIIMIIISFLVFSVGIGYTQSTSELFLDCSPEKSGFSFQNGYSSYEFADLTVEPHCVDNPSMCGNYAKVEGVSLENISVDHIPARGYLSDEAGYEDCGELEPNALYVNKNKDGSYYAFVLTNHKMRTRCDHEMVIRYKLLLPGGGNSGGNTIISNPDWEEVDVYEFNYLNWPNANWAEWGSVTVGSQIGGAASSRRTYLLFDTDKYLSTWNGNDKVELEFWGDSRKGSAAAISIYRVNSSWNPGTGTYISGQEMPNAQNGEITWNNQPKIDFSREWATITIPANSAYSNWRWDITNLAREWKNSNLPNYGLVMIIKGEGTAIAQCIFTSSESEKNQPRLVFGGDPGKNIVAVKNCDGEGFYGFIPDESVSENAAFSMPFSVCNSTELTNMDAELIYDPQVVRLENMNRGSLIGNAMFQYNIIHSGKALFSFAGNKAFVGSGSVAEMVFKAIKPAEAYTPVSVKVINANTVTGQNINLVIADGSISILGRKGDCDKNGVMDERDAMAALQIAVMRRPFDNCYDMNDDGIVNSIDARLIMKSIVLITP